MALTTAARVRHRINATDSDISDSELSEFIADEQAYIEECAEKTFAESDPQFPLARSVCTDRCAAKALIHILGLSAGITYDIDELKIRIIKLFYGKSHRLRLGAHDLSACRSIVRCRLDDLIASGSVSDKGLGRDHFCKAKLSPVSTDDLTERMVRQARHGRLHKVFLEF